MANLNSKRFDAADETRTPDKTKIEIVDLGGTKVARMTAQPGWRWSECIKPGHDAWVVGGEPFVAYEFDSTTAETYARPS